MIFSPLAASGQVQANQVSSARPTTSQFDEYRAQLATGEPLAVLQIATAMVDAIESEGGRYAEQLVEPLLLVGDAFVAGNNHLSALDAFTRALEVSRMNRGFQDYSQKEIYTRLAKANDALGEVGEATLMYESAFGLAENEYGWDDERILEPAIELQDWYIKRANYAFATLMGWELLRYANKHWDPRDIRLIKMHLAFSHLARYSFFPPQREFGNQRVAGTHELYELPDNRGNLPNLYGLGKSALLRVVEHYEEQAESDPIALGNAVLHLADYYQVAWDTTLAFRRYRQAYSLLVTDPDRIEKEFSKPRLLYINLPTLPSDFPASRDTGVVELNLSISKFGRVIRRRTANVEPRNRDREHQVRNATKNARFRPQVRDGEPQTTHDFSLIHEYPLPR